jgi:NTE family protein
MWALVLSAGSALGAYQVGVLKYVAHVLGWKFSLVYGVSVGGVNGGFIVMYPSYELPQAVDALEHRWLTMGTKGVYKRHCPFGQAHVFGNRMSLYNLNPLKQQIHEALDVTKININGYKLGVGVTSWNTGEYKVVNHTNPEFEKYMYATTAQALGFPPIEIDREWWMDGGIRNAVPLKAALDSGATNVLVILTEASHITRYDGKPKHGLDVGLRAIQIAVHEVFNNDIPLAMNNTKATIHIVRPQTSLIADPLDFDKEQAKRLIERGYEDAVGQLGDKTYVMGLEV